MSSVPPRLQTITGAPSWTFASDCVEASLTQDGGHLAPVRFKTPRGVVQPFSIAPWAEESLAADTAPVLKTLRGDFFCAPFGGNQRAWRGERHPAHGETATGKWSFVEHRTSAIGVEFVTRMQTRVRPGEITKRIQLRHGETNIYCLHELRGFSGPMNLGHHTMLNFSEANGPGQILLSPWKHGAVRPQPFENPETGGYSALQTGATFRSLNRVPRADGGMADLSQYPARAGFEDLVMVSSNATPRQLAWTSVTFAKAGWLWFALKDPRKLASTLLWHSNGGRHYPPWNGRHRQVLGLEEITGYFDLGLAESVAPNPISDAGIPTVLQLSKNLTTIIPYVMGVVALPRNFKRLKSLRLLKNQIVMTSTDGIVIRHAVDLSFFKIPSAMPADLQSCGPRRSF